MKRVKLQLKIDILILLLITGYSINAQIIFNDSFEDATLNSTNWNVTWWTPSGQLDQGIDPEIVTTPVRYGTHAVKIRAQYNWNGVSDYSRTELTANRNDNGSHHTFFYPGKEYWIGFSVYVPTDWISDYKSEELFFQLHGNEGDRSPSLGLYVNGDEWYWYIRWGAVLNSPDIDGQKTLWKSEYEKGKWIDWVVHAKFSYSNDGYGFMEIWKNGVSVATHSGPNCYNDDQKIRGPQTGIYKWNWANGNGFDVNERVVYLDEYKVGGENSTYEDVAPGSSLTADFTYKTINCDSKVQFTNKSSDAVTDYLWKFGDGTTSTEKNPSHIYKKSGIHTVELIASKGSASSTKTKDIKLYFAPLPTDLKAVKNTDGTVSLSTTTDVGTIKWYDVPTGGIPIGVGNNFTTPVTNTSPFYAETNIGGQIDTIVGKSDKGTGNYYEYDDSDAMWGLNFDASYDFTLKSVKVWNGNSATGSYIGSRTFTVMDSNGDTITSKTIDVVDGEQTLMLNMSIPAGKGYRLISDMHKGLWRTTTGAKYPYSINDVLTITGGVRYDGISPVEATAYYFFYDWNIEVNSPTCVSDRATVYLLSAQDKINNNLLVYPIPTVNYLNISGLPVSNCIISLYDVSMHKISSIQSNGMSDIKINFNELSPGIYFCKITSKKRLLLMKKVVVIN